MLRKRGRVRPIAGFAIKTPASRPVFALSAIPFLMLLAMTSVAAADPVPAPPAAAHPDLIFVYAVIAIVILGTFFGVAATKAALAGSRWSLADALSEEVDITFEQADADGVKTPKFDDSGKPIMVTELRASSSRVIAFMGLIVIMMMFLGFGVFILYSFATGGGMPAGLDQVYKFLFAGLTMFAPYLVNKFASVFDWMTPKNS